MKKSFLLLLVGLFMVVSSGFGQGTDGDVKQTIIDMEKQITDLIKAGDWDAFGSHLSDEFLSVYAWGISHKQEELESMANLTMDTYEMSDVKVIQPAQNVAIIAYKVNSSGSYKGEPFEGTYYASSTYIKEDGQWKGVMHTEAKMEEMDSDMNMDNHMDMDKDTTATDSYR